MSDQSDLSISFDADAKPNKQSIHEMRAALAINKPPPPPPVGKCVGIGMLAFTGVLGKHFALNPYVQSFPTTQKW